MRPWTPSLHLPAALLLAAGALPLAAQAPRLQLDHLDRLAHQASEVVDVTLDGSSLQMARQFMGQDPASLAVARKLQGIYVKSFEFDRTGAYAPADLDPIRAQLKAPGWTRIVRVQSPKDGQVEVYLLGDGRGGNLALAVLAAEPRELTVVNLVGPLDLKSLGALEGQLGIPRLGPATTHSRPEASHGAR